MRALAAALALAALGCARGPAPTVTADGAIPAIAIHADRSGGRAVAVIAERREVEIVDGAFTVDDLLGDVVLASLAVEAIDGGSRLVVRRCARPALGEGASVAVGHQVAVTTAGGARVDGALRSADPAGVIVAGADGRDHELSLDAVADLAVVEPLATGLRCEVEGGTGRRQLRLVYTSWSFAWSARYHLRLAADGEARGGAAAMTPRFAIVAPRVARPRPVAVTLVAGLPGDGTLAPAQVWSGTVTLDGDVEVAGAPTTRSASVGWVYRGLDPAGARDERHDLSHTLVTEELELAPTATDVPGPVEIERADGARVRSALPPIGEPDGRGVRPALRLVLATSAELVGYRRWRFLASDGAGAIDELVYSVANRGDAPARVRIEEPLRGRSAAIRFAAPEGQGEVDRQRFWREVTVAPGGVVRGAVVLAYGRVD